MGSALSPQPRRYVVAVGFHYHGMDVCFDLDWVARTSPFLGTAVPRVLCARRLFRVEQEGSRRGTGVRGDHRYRQVEAAAWQQARRCRRLAVPKANALPGSLEEGKFSVGHL